jgi:2,5-diketo-D-gluconate reductase A
LRQHAEGLPLCLRPAWTAPGLDYLDLYLIHWPITALNKFVDTFKAFAHLQDRGRIRSIGVGNFELEHLMNEIILIDATGIVPTVNQVELHPRTEAWALTGRGALLTRPTVTAVAEGRGGRPRRC